MPFLATNWQRENGGVRRGGSLRRQRDFGGVDQWTDIPPMPLQERHGVDN
jgi:hypothetical protein